ncbi:PIG-L family deacetylase [Streptomyces sp. P9(2023)]|uniref:PIG-L family deacetylase n=1 Tax=Streptomyces sp. P9(2023) TaxID=3064394 RepID=UPI0028F3ECA9|nr:PIG-L family deacetylase [Streptomyces sp. P9(2023)]MDT9688087.1 PIG-L family deacetylase [Streptomyces sp. P9(2023)]
MPVRRRLRPVSVLTTTAVVAGSFVGLLQLTSGSVFGAESTESRAVRPAEPADRADRTTDRVTDRAEQEADKGAAARKAARPPVVPVRTPDVSVAQIVAHPDDDLYFMNPDTAQSIHSGRSLTTVYLTSGEADGFNGPRAAADRSSPDKAGFAAARQNGIRAAYAEMATGSRTSPWDRVSIPTVGGGAAELDTLRAAPQVSLVWLQLREAGAISADRPHSLNGLWNGRVPVLASQRAAGTPVATDFTYSKEQVIEALTGLLERLRPTFVRMQDPTPGLNPKTGKFTDHQDHLYGARFAQAALGRYAARSTPSGRPYFGVQNYLGYPTSALPHTLDPASAEAKLRTLRTYAWSDGINDCGDPAGCGDLKVARRPAGSGWTQTVRYARGTSTSWVQRDRDGGLHAFSVLDGRLAVWTKPGAKPGAKPTGTAAEWQGPVLLPGGGLDSGVTSVRLPDGRIAVFGTRTTLDGTAGSYRREVVTTEQSAPGGSFGPWRSLGTPERDDARGTSDISAPAVAVDGTGRATVVLRDSAHRLTASEQRPDGGWGAWRWLGADARGRADFVYGDPVATTDAAGRVHVFAGTAKTVLTWSQQRPGAPLGGPRATGLPATTLALNASPAPDGDGVRLWFRKPASGDLRTADLPGTGGGLASPVTELAGGIAGYGPVGGGPGMLAVRSRTGVLATAPEAADQDAADRAGRNAASGTGRTGVQPLWTLENFLFSGAPGGVVDGVAAIGLDGKLHWTPAVR